ncbi:MAG: LysR family transcriptional regulator [Burkholderiaceae bacterium]
MSLRQLKTLIAVAELGSFGKAAEAIFLTPAAVSQQMKALETELGVALFDRHKRTPGLTPLGYALVPKAREVVKAYAAMIRPSVADFQLHDEITIGAVPTTMTGLIPRTVKALRDIYGGLHIRIVPGLSSELLRQVERGFLDAAILSWPANLYGHLHWRVFAEEELIVIAHRDEIEDEACALLQNRPFIRFNRRAWVGQQIEAWLLERKICVRESMELDTLESIDMMVHYGLGVSIVPRRCVLPPHTLDLKYVSLDPPSAPRLLGLLSRQDTEKSALIDIVLAELARQAQLG